MEKPSAYKGDEPYIFVCYAHEDADSVYPEIAWLQCEGVNVWYDEGISLGTEWTQALADAIQGCSRFLFFVTPSSVTREHCRRELNFAQEEGRDVIAVHLQPAEVPGGLRLSLNNRQAIFKHELADEQYRSEVLQALLGEAAEPAAIALPPSSPTRGPRLAIYAAAALLIVAAGAWWFSVDEQETVEPAATQAEPVDHPKPDLLHNSIAVLPFDNLSPDPNNAYFAAGIHEEVLNQLAKIKDLSVIARATMVRYANSEKSIPTIGSELNVGTVMSGSVRYAGDKVRIGAQLIDAPSGKQLWSETYEENLEDVFGIQLSLATRIVDTLAAEFSPQERNRIANPATKNPEAYAHYLRAVTSFGNLASLAPMHEALDEAIDLDANFAAALAYKAFLYGIGQHPRLLGPDANGEMQKRSITLASDYAERALKLDETQSRAHHALAVRQMFNRDWPGHLRTMDRLYALNPSDYVAANTAGLASLVRGDLDRAVALYRRSIELNPADVANIWNFGEYLYLEQHWDDAKEQAQVVVANAGEAAFGYSLLAKVNSHMGDVEGVRRNGVMAESRSPGLYDLADIALAYQRIGDLDSARRIFELAGAGDVSTIANLDWQFWMHMAVEDYDAAVAILERFVEENFPASGAFNLHYFADHPNYDPIRSHPKFEVLVEAVSQPLQGKDAL